MPLVLKHKITNQIYTCMLVNNYQLAYYGTKYWEGREEAEQQLNSFLASQGIEDMQAWGLLELSENQLKLCNVKLKNDPRVSLRWDEDKQTAAAELGPNISPSKL
ncbi:hypothetical protein [Paenibacillus rigui]|uniref:hypothetical protein n=1 Tax=Paenibacillus rigui TaxID=554312 RepID=UPI0011812D79|nr:hypothetical protein [Paenibacillus rigui]